MRNGHTSIVLNSQIFPLPVFCKQFYDVEVSSHFLALMPLKAQLIINSTKAAEILERGFPGSF